MRGALILLALCASAWGQQQTTLQVDTPQERADLEWALKYGSQLYGKAHPGLVALYARWQAPDAIDAPKDIAALWADYAAQNVPLQWSGNVATGDAGTLSQASIDNMLARINTYRAIAGLEPVTNSASLNARCQAACLYMSANTGWQMSHTLDPAGKWYTAAAADAAGRSCIDRDSDGVAALADFMRDFGWSDENKFVGHRRWLLLPTLKTVGIGAIPAGVNWPASACIYVNGSQSGTITPWAWPAAGAFPFAITPERWSYSTAADVTGAAVRVDGKPVGGAAQKSSLLGNVVVFQPSYIWNGPSRHEVVIALPGGEVSYTVDRVKQ